MKVAMMTYSIKPRGGVVHSSKLAEHLARLGIEVELFCLGKEDDAEHDLKFYRPLEVPCTILPFKPKTSALASQVREMIKEYEDNLPNDFDIYHTHDCIGGNALYNLKKKRSFRAPTIRTVHHIDAFRSKLLLNFQENAVKYCDHKLVVSKYWQDHLRENYEIDSEITYNGVETHIFNPNVDGMKIRGKHGLKDEPLILFVGGLEPRKGLEYLLLAMELVLKQIPNARLISVGKKAFSSYRGEKTFFNVLIKRLKLENAVEFTSGIDDEELPKYYAACDVFVLPTRMEGWGLSLMEAMACKKPVVSTTVGGVPELVDDGVNGYLCPPGDVSIMAKRIIHLLKDKKTAEKMGEMGLKKVKDFSWERTAKKVKDIYQRILQEG
jgi:glycosyltransferase-like protein